MNLDKLNRSITLLCPTCGNTEMKSSSGDRDVSTLFECNSCGLKISKDDLIRANQENINANIDELKKLASKEVKDELIKTLRNAFKGNKNIKFK